MFPEIQSLMALFVLVHERRRMLTAERRARGEAGYSTEAVLATALLAALALGVVGIIVVKVTDRANTIDVGK
jgi:hypothetical protein